MSNPKNTDLTNLNPDEIRVLRKAHHKDLHKQGSKVPNTSYKINVKKPETLNPQPETLSPTISSTPCLVINFEQLHYTC